MASGKYEVVLVAADPTKLSRAVGILNGAGIPCSVASVANSVAAAFDPAVLGEELPVYSEVRVPEEFEDQACAALEEAWWTQRDDSGS